MYIKKIDGSSGRSKNSLDNSKNVFKQQKIPYIPSLLQDSKFVTDF